MVKVVTTVIIASGLLIINIYKFWIHFTMCKLSSYPSKLGDVS